MASYERQKKAAFAHLRVDQEDQKHLETGQFTLFDFLEHAYAFSPKRRQLAADVLALVKEKPRSFKHLLAETRAPKSALFGILTSLKNSGLLETGPDGVFQISVRFSQTLRAYSLFWENWSKQT